MKIRKGFDIMFGLFKKKEEAKNEDLSTVFAERKISLEKHIPDSLNGKKARVVFCIDRSGSMWGRYNNGEVQRTVERLFPVALKFDDDGKMECYSFNTKAERHPDIDVNNIRGYVDNNIECDGGTNYSPVMRAVTKNANIPTYVIFITDGDNQDKNASREFIKEISDEPIFWKFIGIGNERFTFLEELDDMNGRVIDNADFVKIENISNISDDELYKLLMQEFSEWWTEAEKKGIIK